MSNKIKKILTVDDLIKFCQNQKFMKFDSQETGYQIAVKVPTSFELESNTDDNHRGMLKLKIKIFHTLLNRNKSYISKESAEKAMLTIPDRPVLAALHQLESGEWDFAGHEAEIIEDENGNEEFRYIESQVGSFSSEPAFWEHDDELDKDFVCAYAYIAMEYTKACEVLERKKGTKNSCELCVDKFEYNAKEKYLELKDFYVSGSTLLGCTIDGEKEIQEGMQGSRADIIDFSTSNNSLFSNYESKMIEFQERLEKLESACFNNNNSKKGGDVEKMSILEELLTKYSKTIEDITFEYENLSDEELSAKFEEVFGKCGDGKKKKCEEDPDDKPDDDVMEPDDDLDDINEPDDPDDDLEDSDDYSKEDNACGSGKKKKCEEDDSIKDDNACNPDKKKKCEEDDEDSASKEDNACGDSKKKKNSVEYSVTFEEKVRKFEVSLDEKIDALYRLVNETYADADNTWYGVKVYEKHVVMIDWCSNKCYKQSYTFEDDVCSLTGDRVEVFAEYVTADEQKELESMRANYSSISAKLAQYEEAEEIADKMNVFSDEAYSNYLDTDEFKALMEKDIVKKFTKEELVEKADAALGKLVKTTKTFSVVTDKKEEKKEAPSFFAFGRIEQDTSFLDGLLKK